MKRKASIEKSIFTREYSELLKLLKERREESGITQVELAKLLGKTQSFISKWERGDRRLDVIQLRNVCHAIGITLPDFVSDLEKRLRQIKIRR